MELSWIASAGWILETAWNFEPRWLAASLPQLASLWAIRISVACMLIAYWLQISTGNRSQRELLWFWWAGFVLAALHTVSALWAFHGGSHATAVNATADKTEAWFGWRFGAGVYVNYAFVLVWGLDALARTRRWGPGPLWLQRTIDGFLIFVAINGAIVFAEGPIRWISLAGVSVMILEWWWATARNRRSAISQPRERRSPEP